MEEEVYNGTIGTSSALSHIESDANLVGSDIEDKLLMLELKFVTFRAHRSDIEAAQ